MKGLKVLPLDCPEDCFLGRMLIKEHEKHHVEITPKFNRPGRYYNRYEGIAWVEMAGRAWLEAHPDQIHYEIEALNHRPLTNKIRGAILTVLISGIKNEDLRKLLYRDTCWKECRNIRTRTKLWRMRLDKRKAQLKVNIKQLLEDNIMNVYECTCDEWSAFWESFEATEIVVANTEEEALGVCLQHYDESIKAWWKITKIDTNKFGFHGER